MGLTGVSKCVETRMFQRVGEVWAGCLDVEDGWGGVAEPEPNLNLWCRFEPTVRHVTGAGTLRNLLRGLGSLH